MSRLATSAAGLDPRPVLRPDRNTRVLPSVIGQGCIRGVSPLLLYPVGAMSACAPTTTR